MLFPLIFHDFLSWKPLFSIFFTTYLFSSYVIFPLSDFLQLSSTFLHDRSKSTPIAYVIDPQWMDSLGIEHDRSFRNRFGKLPHLQSPYRNTSTCIYGYVHNVAILRINNSTYRRSSIFTQEECRIKLRLLTLTFYSEETRKKKKKKINEWKTWLNF